MPATDDPRVIQIAVPRPLHAVYDYALPADMPVPAIGARVRVPFAGARAVGVCVATEVANPHQRLKEVLEVLDEQAFVDAELMDLARWMSGYYHYPLGEVLAAILPAAARKGAPGTIKPPDCWRIETPFDNPRAKAQQALYDHLAAHGPLAGAALVEAGFKRAILAKLADGGHVVTCAPGLTAEAETPPVATPPQNEAIAAIHAAERRFAPFLLEGVTGSGKTEVYLRAMAGPLAHDEQVLVLVPEIALTPQTLRRFARRFGAVGMLHSNLSDPQRLQTWLKCASGELKVLIGTRSAALAPFAKLGMIVVDEEHDASYKQQDGLRYSARDVAIKRAQTAGVPIVLGSATPSLESLNNVARGRYTRLSLPSRAGGAEMPSYHVIDMRGQSQTDGISLPLERVLKRHIDAEGQVLVFLNRRGYAPTLLCAACGWQAQCSDCDARLTLHRDPARLICHHCTLGFNVPATCEGCGQRSLMPVGMGTQRTEARLRTLFPRTPIYRIDRDTTRSTQALERTFAQVNTGKPCILVGTQMLAKGHHFPNVTLVAVQNADAGFLSPDFRAPERTAQLIVQVAGRAGRAERAGEVWIQSYQPDNANLACLIRDGYPGFAALELANRVAAGMPPARPMAMLRAESPSENDALGLLLHLKEQLGGIERLGPVPAPLTRVANRSRFQLMLLSDTRAALHAALERLQIPRLPRGLRWSIDVDPYDSL